MSSSSTAAAPGALFRRRGWRSLGLRGRVILTFAVGALLISLALAASVFTISRGYLVEQRERSAGRQAAADLDLVRARLAVPGASAPEVLTALDPPADTAVLLHWRDQWFASEPGIGPYLVPEEVRRTVLGGGRALTPLDLGGQPYLLVAAPVGGSGGTVLYEFAPLLELRSTLSVLRTVLAASAMAATLGGAALGLWASRRVLHPLHHLATTAGRIAGGQLDTRLPTIDDPDLSGIIASFNTMVDSLQQRIERERRFFADVSHELRTPLTTLVASVGVLRRHEDELPQRSRTALGLVATELDHLRRLLDDLLALARTEAGLHQDELEPLSLAGLLGQTLTRSGRPAGLLHVQADSTVTGRKLALQRAFNNLLDNADRHGGGLVAMSLHRDDCREEPDEGGEPGGLAGLGLRGGLSWRGGHGLRDGHGVAQAVVHVDDAGPGVPAADQQRIFDRFATGHTARGSSAGTGLGLALVAETIAAHHGHVRYQDRPGGGARFVVTLPAVDG